MKSMTPKTSVRPAAIRNNSTPSCNPFSIWTIRSAVDIEPGCFGCACRDDAARASRHRFQQTRRLLAATSWGRKRLFHRAVLGIAIAIIRKHLLDDLGFELAIRTLGDFDQIEILDRVIVIEIG